MIGIEESMKLEIRSNKIQVTVVVVVVVVATIENLKQCNGHVEMQSTLVDLSSEFFSCLSPAFAASLHRHPAVLRQGDLPTQASEKGKGQSEARVSGRRKNRYSDGAVAVINRIAGAAAWYMLRGGAKSRYVPRS